MKTELIIIGAGGHAKVLIDCLQRQATHRIIGILENNKALHGLSVAGIPILGGDDKIKDFSRETVQLVNAVGSVDIPVQRKKVYDHFKAQGFQFYSVIHPSAVVAESVQLGEGVQIMAGAIVQADCKVGDNVIINTGASADHDVQLENHIHIAPGVVISGNVTIGMATHVGVRAVILQGLQIGHHVLIGAGAVVINHVTPNSRVVGVPAKSIAMSTEDLAHE